MLLRSPELITFLGFLQYQSNTVIVVCTLMGTLQIGTADIWHTFNVDNLPKCKQI